MKRVICIFVVFILLASALGMFTTTAGSKDPITDLNSNLNTSTAQQFQDKNEILNNLDVFSDFFTENQGQVDSAVKYYIVGKGIWFLDDGIVFEIKEQPKKSVVDLKYKGPTSYENDADDTELLSGVIVKLNFLNSNKVIPVGIDPLPHKSNFFFGNDQTEWCTDVPSYRDVVYKDIYNNIDLRYYLTPVGLKYDFIVHPGGAPGDIVLNFEGIVNLYVNTNDDLAIRTAIGEIQDTDLFIYQANNNAKFEVNGKFKLIDPNTYGFEMTGSYDKNTDLVIDPALVYSTYLGGSGMDYGYAIEVDSTKNAYVGGHTSSSDFNMTVGAYQTSKSSNNDLFILKINPTGTDLVWATYLGGNGDDQSRDLAIDSSNNVYVTGYTHSSTYPTASSGTPYDTALSGARDAFCSKLSSGGNSLTYSTYYGGSEYDTAHSIALDSSNNMYITGETQSSADLPTTPGCLQPFWGGGIGTDIFFAKISTAGGGASDLLYSTYMGGSTGGGGIPGNEMGFAIIVDSSGNAYITGTTYSNDINTTTNAYDTSLNGLSDAILLKINPAGGGTADLVYSTYIGGTTIPGGGSPPYQDGYGIDLDSNNYAVVTGRTNANDFPVTAATAYDPSFNAGTSNFECDIFVFKINCIASATPAYSTYIGGSGDDIGYDIAVDSLDDAYVSGITSWTTSPPSDFPVTLTAYDQSHNGQYDAVVCKLSTSNPSMSYASYLGGGGYDYGYGIAYDSESRMYVTGYTSGTGPMSGGGGFPNSTGAYDQTFNGGFNDAFATKLEFNNLPVVLDLSPSCYDVMRTSWVYVYANGSDVEDAEGVLTPWFEYKPGGAMTWRDTTNDPVNMTGLVYTNNLWRIRINFPVKATLGFYDFQVKFTDTGSMVSVTKTLPNGMYLHNNLPNMVGSLSLSQPQAKQGEEVSVIVNGDDIEDLEADLKVTVEYRDPTNWAWNISYISSIPLNGVYVGGQWLININVSVGKTYDFGTFDFRANISDTDNGFTGWFYLMDSLLITNDAPDFLDVGLSRYNILRNNSVFLYSNCSDYETLEFELTYSAQYKHEGDTGWTDLTDSAYSTDRWRSKFGTDIYSKLGEYSFRVKFEDNMGLSTDWQEIDTPLTVVNNKPVILDSIFGIDNIEIELDPVEIFLSDYELDVEDGHLNLNWSVPAATYFYLESVEIIDINMDLLKITPKFDVEGEEDITLILSDKDGDTDTIINLTIIVDSMITFVEPKVTLLQPSDNDKVITTRPTLEWELDNPDGFEVNFTVYMDENQNPTTVRATGLETFSYTIDEDLDDNSTYYWYIAPSFGIGPVKPFNFTIKLGYQKVYRINMTSEFNLLSLKQGQKGYSNLTVKNKGNVADTIRFDLTSLKLKQHLDLNKSSLQLQSQGSDKVQLIINTPPSFEEGWYLIKVTAKSMGNASQTDSVNIWVEVYSKFEIRDYNVTIEVVPNSIDIQQTKSGTVKLIIENTGNQFEEYNLDYQSTDFFGTSVEIGNVTVRLDPGIEISVEVTITVPATMELGPHTISFIVKSGASYDQNDLVVNVLKKPDVPGGIDNNGDGDTIDPGDDHDGDGLINSVDPDDDNDGILDEQDETPFGEATATDSDGDDNSMMIIAIVVVVVIVVVMLVVLMFLRKKKEEKYLKELEEETEDERIELGDDQPPTPPTEPPGEPAELPMAQPMPAESDPAAQPPESPSVRIEPTPEPEPVPTPMPEVQQPTDAYYQEPTAEGYTQEQPTYEPEVQPEYDAAPTPTPEVATTDTPTPEVETTDTPAPAVAQPVVAKPVE